MSLNHSAIPESINWIPNVIIRSPVILTIAIVAFFPSFSVIVSAYRRRKYVITMQRITETIIEK